MSSSAASYLADERKKWRKNPIFGFTAKPVQNPDKTLNLFEWECTIPGKKLTPWEGGQYKIKIFFQSNHPETPPFCKFDPPIFHPNVSASGKICVSILSSEWHSSITFKNILFGIQALLDNPGTRHPENYDAAQMYRLDRSNYDQKVRKQAKSMSAS